MAEKEFFLIPADPLFVPTEDAQKKALAYFQEAIPMSEGGCHGYSTEHTELVDAGCAFEDVICPQCDQHLPIYGSEESCDTEGWWDSIQENEMKNNPDTAVIKMPCCKADVKLINLKFNGDGAFAKFVLKAYEPSSNALWETEDAAYEWGFLAQSTLEKFEQIVGCKMKQIWAVHS